MCNFGSFECFYAAVRTFKKLKRRGKLPSVLRSSLSADSIGYNRKLKYLSTTPDGVCVLRGNQHSHYSRRGVICADYHGSKYESYLGKDDVTLFGYGQIVDDSIREDGYVYNVWDLETSQDLNLSDCCSVESGEAWHTSKDRLLSLVNFPDRKHPYHRYYNALVDEIIFDKYKRTVSGD